MSRSRPFRSSYNLSRQAMVMAGFDIVGEAKAELEAQTEAMGPRGGRYRLGPVLKWSEGPSADWTRDTWCITAFRIGTYARPSQH